MAFFKSFVIQSIFLNELHTFKKLWRHLDQSQKRKIIFVLLLTLMAGLAEAMSLGLVIPFLAAIASPDKILFLSPVLAYNDFIKMSKFSIPINTNLFLITPTSVVSVMATIFVLGALFAGLTRLLLVGYSVRLASNIGTQLGGKVFERTLYQPYKMHTLLNTSGLISVLTTKVTTATTTINAGLNLLASLVLILFISATLFVVSPMATIIAAAFLGLCYGAIIISNERKIAFNSRINSQQHLVVLKLLQEGFGSIRDVLIDGNQKFLTCLYLKADSLLRSSSANITILGQSPRHIIESLGLGFFALVAWFLCGRPSGIVSALPILGALALGVQRLLPALQQAYQAWSSILAYQDANQDVLRLLDQSIPCWAYEQKPRPLLFKKEIRFNAVKFRYSNESPWVLNDLSFAIPRGSRVGFVGKTGSGKSTSLDLLMGLLEPTEGTIMIDNTLLNHKNLRAWQGNIAHVPQTIYLSDSSLAENIAFGVPHEEINMNKVREAAHQAQIAEFIESSPMGYRALVGERGIRLSGGQRQRIGISRALYKQAQLLILDEATSALDHETEDAVMAAVNSSSPDLTILIVTHRVSTLKNCQQIIDLNYQPASTTKQLKKVIKNISP